jgi:hypothetical protein
MQYTTRAAVTVICPGFFVAKKQVTLPENIACREDPDNIDCYFLCHIYTKVQLKMLPLQTI